MRFGPVFAGLAACALVAAGCSGARAPDDSALLQLVDDIARHEISRSPELASTLGIVRDPADHASPALLDDRSIASSQRIRTERLDALHDLERIDRSVLSADGRRILDTALFTYEAAVNVDRHGYGYAGLGWASPYLINQSDGAYIDVVKLLLSHHPIRSRADADAWLARLDMAATTIRDERRRFEIDMSSGVVPPRRILQRTLDRIATLAPRDPKDHLLTLHFAEELSQIPDIPVDDLTAMIDEAARIVGEDLAASYSELADTIRGALMTAPDSPGVWRLKNGDTYYQDTLRLYTSTDFTPKQVHEIGLALVADLQARVDSALLELGHTDGDVGARMAALGADPAYHYPRPLEDESLVEDPGAAEAQMIADIEARLYWAQTELARIVSVGPAGSVELRQAPTHTSANAPLAYYKPASLDGIRSATYNLNMREVAHLPAWSLPTLTFHESVPGHHLQAGLAHDRTDQPLLLSMFATAALSEGWAVYGEDLAAELGAYVNDPEATLGYLQSILFRAARLVADTGIHSERWSREQAVEYLVSTTGLSRASMENEVDRYTIWPGHACAYMIGREKIRNLRENADIELGPDFDLKAFHDTVLRWGGRPLDVVETDVQDWIIGVKAASAAALATD